MPKGTQKAVQTSRATKGLTISGVDQLRPDRTLETFFTVASKSGSCSQKENSARNIIGAPALPTSRLGKRKAGGEVEDHSKVYKRRASEEGVKASRIPLAERSEERAADVEQPKGFGDAEIAAFETPTISRKRSIAGVNAMPTPPVTAPPKPRPRPRFAGALRARNLDSTFSGRSSLTPQTRSSRGGQSHLHTPDLFKQTARRADDHSRHSLPTPVTAPRLGNALLNSSVRMQASGADVDMDEIISDSESSEGEGRYRSPLHNRTMSGRAPGMGLRDRRNPGDRPLMSHTVIPSSQAVERQEQLLNVPTLATTDARAAIASDPKPFKTSAAPMLKPEPEVIVIEDSQIPPGRPSTPPPPIVIEISDDSDDHPHPLAGGSHPPTLLDLDTEVPSSQSQIPLLLPPDRTFDSDECEFPDATSQLEMRWLVMEMSGDKGMKDVDGVEYVPSSQTQPFPGYSLSPQRQRRLYSGWGHSTQGQGDEAADMDKSKALQDEEDEDGNIELDEEAKREELVPSSQGIEEEDLCSSFPVQEGSGWLVRRSFYPDLTTSTSPNQGPSPTALQRPDRPNALVTTSGQHPSSTQDDLPPSDPPSQTETPTCARPPLKSPQRLQTSSQGRALTHLSSDPPSVSQTQPESDYDPADVYLQGDIGGWGAGSTAPIQPRAVEWKARTKIREDDETQFSLADLTPPDGGLGACAFPARLNIEQMDTQHNGIPSSQTEPESDYDPLPSEKNPMMPPQSSESKVLDQWSSQTEPDSEYKDWLVERKQKTPTASKSHSDRHKSPTRQIQVTYASGVSETASSTRTTIRGGWGVPPTPSRRDERQRVFAEESQASIRSYRSLVWPKTPVKPDWFLERQAARADGRVDGGPLSGAEEGTSSSPVDISPRKHIRKLLAQHEGEGDGSYPADFPESLRVHF